MRTLTERRYFYSSYKQTLFVGYLIDTFEDVKYLLTDDNKLFRVSEVFKTKKDALTNAIRNLNLEIKDHLKEKESAKRYFERETKLHSDKIVEISQQINELELEINELEVEINEN